VVDTSGFRTESRGKKKREKRKKGEGMRLLRCAIWGNGGGKAHKCCERIWKLRRELPTKRVRKSRSLYHKSGARRDEKRLEREKERGNEDSNREIRDEWHE